MAQFNATRMSAFAAILAISFNANVSVGSRSVGYGAERIRVATFNAALHGSQAGEIGNRLANQRDPQAKKIAEIVQIVRPDILLINELDHDEGGTNARLLAENYFSVAQGNQKPIDFPFVHAPATNTGVDSGLDLNGNQRFKEPEDAWGYGRYPGQYGMAIYSRFPLQSEDRRTFQKLRWSQLPWAQQPLEPSTGRPYYSKATWDLLRLSSKNHVDMPIRIGDQIIHLLASHPTPPVFDGPEDRNGCRNHDEIRFWSDYIANSKAAFIIDDQDVVGGLKDDEAFIIVGDLNSDPGAGDSQRHAVEQLLTNAKIHDPRPIRRNPLEAAIKPDRDSKRTFGDATADFGDSGKLRVDYVLPSRQLTVHSSGIFWPDPNDDQDLVSASDHRLVWVDLELP